VNRLSEERQRLLAVALMKGSTIRQTADLIETNIPSVLRNMMWMGKAALKFHDDTARNLKCKFVECDECTSFIYAKDENLPDELKGLNQFGDLWTYAAIDTQSRFMITWRIGKHISSDVQRFTDDLASRIPGHVQIHSDQLGIYRPAFEKSFGDKVAYATTRKTMSGPKIGLDGKYLQPDLTEARIRSEMGNPDMDKVTTNHVERSYLTLRTWNRGYTRQTIAFSRKPENAEARLAINYFYYNFIHQHASLDGITPAMALGVTDKLWSVRDFVQLVSKISGPHARQ